MDAHLCRPFRALSAGGASPGLKAWAVLLNRFAVKSDRLLGLSSVAALPLFVPANRSPWIFQGRAGPVYRAIHFATGSSQRDASPCNQNFITALPTMSPGLSRSRFSLISSNLKSLML